MKNVLLVFGGVSYEHDISIVTAFQIYKKSRLEKINLILFYVSRDGKYYVVDDKKIDIEKLSKHKFNGKMKGLKEACFVTGEKQKIFIKTRFGLKEFLSASVAIFACHGGDGENGKLVTIFENNGIACSAGSSDALAVCMDKFLFKTIAKGLKIPVVSGFKVSKFDYYNNKEMINLELKKLKFPVILKINSGGSSIGLFKAKNKDEFEEKLNEAFEFDDEVIVEKFIPDTREFNIAILGDKEQFEISEIDEPVKNNEVLTFADKYLTNGSGKSKTKGSMASMSKKNIANLPENIQHEMFNVAKKLFVNLSLHGVVRIDFLYDTKQNKVYVCEVNTIPGSLAFYFFKKNRIVTNDLIERLVFIAEKNFNPNKIKQDYIVDILGKK